MRANSQATRSGETLGNTGGINGGKPEGMSDEDWSDCVKRNKEHLNIMLAKDFWTNEDLAPLRAAAQ